MSKNYRNRLNRNPSRYEPLALVLLNKSLILDLFRGTRACNLHRDGVELELVSRILGHSSSQITRIYATHSVEMMRKAMEHRVSALPNETPLWPADEAEIARLSGIR